MTDKKVLTIPLALAVTGAIAPAAPPKVLRVVAQAEAEVSPSWANKDANPVTVDSQGLGNIIHVIGGAG